MYHYLSFKPLFLSYSTLVLLLNMFTTFFAYYILNLLQKSNLKLNFLISIFIYFYSKIKH